MGEVVARQHGWTSNTGGRERRVANAEHATGEPRRAADLVRDRWRRHARLVRFALVGGICALVQLALLALLLVSGIQSFVANCAAYLLSAQLNFALSVLVIWGDRRAGGLRRRWLTFHGSIAATALLNQVVFLVALRELSDLVASALGIGVAAAVNFLVQDRFVFRHGRRHAGNAPAAGCDQRLAPGSTRPLS